MPVAKIKVGFLFLGGVHQVLHAAPAAAELSTDPQFEVVCFYADPAVRAMLERVIAAWPDAQLFLQLLYGSSWLAVVSFKYRKLGYLLYNCRTLARCRAVITTERTSTILKFLGVKTLIHLPHGAGDGARGFEKRLRRFDLVIVSGEKDAARMKREGVVLPEHCQVSGSVKLGAVSRLVQQDGALFDNDRPVVLYNPHFKRKLSSWPIWGAAILTAFAAQYKYNLIFAPHIRMKEKLSAGDVAALESLAVPGRIIVDLGSVHSCDMRYTRAADIYIGDVSSQVYEFLSRPRPCVFLNAHGVAWARDPSYACWKFGEVVDDLSSVMPAIARAEARHAEFLPVQREALPQAVGLRPEEAPAKAAALIRAYLCPDPVVAG